MGATALQLLPGMPSDEAMRVMAAIPEGYRRAGSAAGWCRTVEQHSAVAELRGDARDNVLAICWTLGRYTDRKSLLTRPGWALIMGLTGLTRSTVSRWLRWLRDQQLIGHVEQGSTDRYRAGQSAEDVGNRAAVYVLLSPAIEPTRTPSPVPSSLKEPLRAREPELSTNTATLRAAGSDLQEAKTGTERLAAAEHLQERVPVARRLSATHLRSLCRDFLVAGWCVRDLHYALDQEPSGTPHPYAFNTSDVRSPAGWIASRLAFWRDQTGAPVLGRRQQQQAEADRIRAARIPAAEQVASPPQHVPSSLHDRDHVASLTHDRELRAQARAAREHEERERIEAWKSTPPATVDPAQRRAEIRRRALARAAFERSRPR